MTRRVPADRLTSSRPVALVLVALAASATAYALARAGMLEIVKKAACEGNANVDCDTKGGLSGFVTAADALISPVIVAMIAVAPLGCLVGAGALMFGNRRGLVIIGSALGTLVFVASLKGIVA